MKRIVSCLCAMCFVGCAVSSFAAGKIGVFDLNRILLEIPQAKEAQQKLQEQFLTRNREVTALQQQLDADANAYNASSATIADALILRQKQEIIVAEQRKLQEMSASLEHDFSVAREGLLQPLLKQVDRAIAKVTREKSLEVALALTSVAYHDAALEITDEVIAELKRPIAPIAPGAPSATHATKGSASKKP